MMSDRVHPDMMMSHETGHSSELPDSPRSSASSASFLRKDPNPSGSYVIQVPKDQIFRVPPPENAHRFKAYTRRGTKNGPAACCRCLACTILVLILLLVAVAAAGAALYVVFRPKIPSYTVDDLSIKDFTLTSGAALSPEIDATVRADNTNKKIGIDYRSGSDISVSYDGVTLCDGSWPTFFQDSRNVTVFTTALKASGLVLSTSTHHSMEAALKRREVPLNLHVDVPIRVKIGAVTTWTFKVKVRCNVTVDTMAVDAKILSNSCSVKLSLR